MTTAGLLRSTGVTPLRRYYEPHRLPPDRLTRVLIPSMPPGYKPQSDGSRQLLLHCSTYLRPCRRPRFLDHSVVTRCPLSPRWANPLRSLIASRIVLASTSPGGWPPTSWCFEPGTGSTLQLTARHFAVRHKQPPSLGEFPEPITLPALCYLYATDPSYMSNQQFTW